MLSAVVVLTLLIAIPNTLAGRTLLEGTTLLATSRTQLGGPIFRVGLFGVIILTFWGAGDGHEAELLRSHRRRSVSFS